MTIEVIWGSGSPFAWRVLLTLEVKGLSYESRLIQFSRGDHRSPEHLALSPRGKVPVLRDGDYVLSESLAIMAYLDRKHPEPPIFGTSAEETGLIWKAISEFQSYVAPLVDRVIVPAFGIRSIDAADMQAAADELHGEFGRMEEAVSARGWLAVERLSAADLAVYPFVEALLRAAGKEAVRPMGLGFLPLAERHPALESWRQRVAGLPGYADLSAALARNGLKRVGVSAAALWSGGYAFRLTNPQSPRGENGVMAAQFGRERRSDGAFAVAISRRAVLQAGAATAIAATSLGRVANVLAAPAIAPFTYHAPESALDDLRQRLAQARWPEREPVGDWSQGVPLAKLRALVDYWRTDHDWRRCEATLNGFDQYRTAIDGLDIHFLHVRSPHADALPILITHGWPGSVIEFFKIIGPLTDPATHGGNAADAFHVVAPSLPGFGFSGKPAERGWNAERIARAWAELMRRLGYDRYIAQGGDWGSVVTTEMARQRAAGLAAIHLNMPFVIPDPLPTEGLSAEEQRAVDAYQRFLSDGFGYFHLQATRPQTIGYALTDSPVGQAAWIYEKFHAWTDNDGAPEDALTRDEILDNITLYWLTGTAASSARMYLENAAVIGAPPVIELPVGCSIFPREIVPAPRSWAERFYPNLIYWNELDRGGHFAAFEQPALFTQELRNCFRRLRQN